MAPPRWAATYSAAARRDAARLEHDDLLVAGQAGVEQRGRHARRLPRAWRGAQDQAVAVAQGVGDRRQEWVDGERCGHEDV
ncbi:MAG: hypothetical protein U0802_01950 [Candidatus Binatia bacterium]